MDVRQIIARAAAAALKDAVIDQAHRSRSMVLGKSGERQAFFPKIEKKYGQPMKYWFDLMKDLETDKYPEQISYLKQEHSFSQAHANALVMYLRGSTSSKRFSTLSQYLSEHDEIKKKTVRKIFRVIQRKYPKLELVISWNTPMLKLDKRYLFGVSVLKNHILIAPYDEKIIKNLKPLLQDYKVNKKTIQVPVNWIVDEKLLLKIISLALKKK